MTSPLRGSGSRIGSVPRVALTAAALMAVSTMAISTGASAMSPGPAAGSAVAARPPASSQPPTSRPTTPASAVGAITSPAVVAVEAITSPPDLAAPTPPAVVAVEAAAVPDRVDRQWPRNPPWDACPRPVWKGQGSVGQPGGGRRVLVIGDSLTRESRVLSARGMRASGWTPTFRCWGSKRLDWGIDQVVRSRALGQLPGHVIVALGTNDISWETQATTEQRVRALLDRLGPKRQVVWVDLHLTRSSWLNARADWFNAMMRGLARSRPNLTVVGWHRIARAHGIHGWDGIHYGPSGYRLRAATVLRALNALGREHPVRPPNDTPGPTGVAELPDPVPAPLPSLASSVVASPDGVAVSP